MKSKNILATDRISSDDHRSCLFMKRYLICRFSCNYDAPITSQVSSNVVNY